MFDLSALALVLLLQLTQVMPLETLLFEGLSALGTVGLSIGGTAMLDNVGKVLVIGAMLAGRVGPLTLFLFLSRREATEGIERPMRDVPVG